MAKDVDYEAKREEALVAIKDRRTRRGVPAYLQQERRENRYHKANILRGPHVDHIQKADIAPITKVTKAPHVDALVADLYTVLLQATAKLREKSEDPDQDIDSQDLAQLTKLVDGTVRLTKLELEREKRDRPEELSDEELAEALKHQIEALGKG